MDKYTTWYYAHKPTDFPSVESFAAAVGPRPGPEWSLIRTTKKSGVPLTPDNFLWITAASLEAAKAGRLEPPILPTSTHTLAQQKTNDERFALRCQPMVDYAQRRLGALARRKELEDAYTTLLDKVTEYVQQAGYEARDALNPEILPPTTHPKLNRARDRLRAIQDELTGVVRHREALAAWNADTRRRREEQKLMNAANYIYTGKRGRPFKRFVQQRVKIADLTDEQRQQHGIPPGATFVERQGPKRKAKVYTIKLTVPNPYQPAGHYANT